ncbi:MAG: NAD(P)-dependent glycerol-3-phosphate dehydrogenase [Syntrophobacterales bacterium]|nr:MAG: NAD(P)-dependent glycerol-3-phosphate dehydrogenase [Syntrophobacterales bacterium]
MNRISIIGDGAWGTALALLLHSKGYNMKIWGNFPEYIEEQREKSENYKFLPGIKIPRDINYTADLADAAERAELFVCAVPTQFIRSVFEKFAPHYPKGVPVVSVAKGIEQKTLKRCTEVLAEFLKGAPLAALSGPSHAEEVARKVPTAVVVASKNCQLSRSLQDIFMTTFFRVYTQEDIIGVELGGALKNVVALAAGMCDGLGYGDNTKSTLLTRGLVEISRLGVAAGAERLTFTGLSGIGDLITTSFSRHSRNRSLGEKIGQGMSLRQAMESTEKVAEGVWTTVSSRELARKLGVAVPITDEAHKVLFEEKDPHHAVVDLMTRSKKQEIEDLE